MRLLLIIERADRRALYEYRLAADDVPMLPSRRGILDFIAALSPVIAGFAFYWWQDWSPKSWIDPQCGRPDWVVVTYIPFLLLPPLLAGIRLRQAGQSSRTTASLVIVALVVTIIACMIAFLTWFTKHNCGE